MTESPGYIVVTKKTESLKYTRIYSDSNGDSHFADEEVSIKLTNLSIQASPIYFSELINLDGLRFCSFPAGWEADWHPAPRRQFYFCMSGHLEVVTSDGDSRQFHAGNVILLEDTFGKGHVTKVIGMEQTFGAFVHLSKN